MGDRVQVESIEVLTHFRVAVVKFSDACKSAMSDVEGDFHHMLNWLENEQLGYWQGQIRKRTDLLSRAREALRSKRVFKDASGRVPQAYDEEKAVQLAQTRLLEAEQKFANVKKYIRILQKEIQTYKGSVQRFATTIESDVPLAIATLDKLMQSLEAYVKLAPSESSPAAPPVLSNEPNQPPPSTEQNPA